jgi:hypothetical protein
MYRQAARGSAWHGRLKNFCRSRIRGFAAESVWQDAIITEATMDDMIAPGIDRFFRSKHPLRRSRIQ